MGCKTASNLIIRWMMNYRLVGVGGNHGENGFPEKMEHNLIFNFVTFIYVA